VIPKTSIPLPPQRMAFWFEPFHLHGISSLVSYTALKISAIETPLSLRIPNDHPWGRHECLLI